MKRFPSQTRSLLHDLAGGLAFVAVAGGIGLGLMALPCRAGEPMTNQQLNTNTTEQIEKRSRSELKKNIEMATEIVNEQKATSTKRGIPWDVIKNAKGIAILEVTKAGVIVSGSGGDGVLIVNTPNGWSAPSAINAGDFGVGAQLGVKITRMVMILNTEDAVNAFAQNSSLGVGASASATAGPSNADADAYTNRPDADIYVYQETDGAFAGAAIEGSLLSIDQEANRKFYGKGVSARDILTGRVPAPPEAAPIYQKLRIKPVHGAG
ncbi:MAG: YSC84-related protein [Verrucomicrobiota bacterium]